MFRLQKLLYKNTDEFVQSAADIRCNIQWFCSCNLGNCYILSVFLQGTLMTVAKANNFISEH